MERLWVPHPDLVWAPCILHDSLDGVARFGTDDGEAVEVPAAEVPRLAEVHGQQVLGVDDICSLEVVSEAALLHTMRVRFKKQHIYTWVSRILLAVNPFQAVPIYSSEVLDEYRSAADVRALPPHIFSIAADALSSLHSSGRNQAIVINGESGAGKTESAKLIMSYVAEATKPGGRNGAKREMSSVEEKVLRTNPVLEAFGNAMTVRNNNSSRFVKWLDFHLSEAGLTGCEIQQYLLEVTRVCSAAKGERSYHIFYQVLQARNLPELKDLALEAPACYRYLKAGELIAPGVDDAACFEETKEALTALGFGDAMQAQILRVVAAVLHLGNCFFAPRKDGQEGVKLDNDAPAQKAAKLLGLKAQDLTQCMLVKKITVGKDFVESPVREDQAKAARDGLSKFLYGLLFQWLIERINTTTQVEQRQNGDDASRMKAALSSQRSLGILDIAGFESFERNSLEQLLINLCNEHLQQFFNNFVFRAELDDYAKEGIQLNSGISFADNADVLQLVDGRGGLLDMLDEEVALPKATDLSYVTKVLAGHGKNNRLVKPKFGGMASFGVRHFAGDVTYHCDGFLEKNMAKPPDSLATLLPSSELELLQALAKYIVNEVPKSIGRKQKASTISSRFRTSLRSLLTNIGAAAPHFVRCIKPNSDKVPKRFDSKMVKEQLLLGGVLESVSIRQMGYASRLPFADFVRRYACICGASIGNLSDPAGAANALLQQCVKKLNLESRDITLGKAKVFMKAPAVDLMETERNKTHSRLATKITSKARGRYVRKRYLVAQKAVKELKDSLRLIGADENGTKVADDRHGSVMAKLGGSPDDARQLLERVQAAMQAMYSLPVSEPLLRQTEAIITRLEKELHVIKQVEASAKSIDPVQLDKILARAQGLGLAESGPMLELGRRIKALQVQLPLVEALRAALNGHNPASVVEVVAEVEKKGLTLSPDGWLPELFDEALARKAEEEQRRQNERQQMEEQKRQEEQRQLQEKRRLEEEEEQQRQEEQRQQQEQQNGTDKQEQEQSTQQSNIEQARQLKQSHSRPSQSQGIQRQSQQPQQSQQPEQSQPAPQSTEPAVARQGRRRPTLTGLSGTAQSQLLASLDQASQEYEAVAMEQLLQEATRHGVDQADLEEHRQLLRKLQSEPFLTSAVEQSLQEVEAECPSRNALQRLQNLSHQLHVLQGDEELARVAARAVQHGTRRRSLSRAATGLLAGNGARIESRRRSIFEAEDSEELRLACHAFCDLRSFSKLKPEGTWKGHRSSQLLRLHFAKCTGSENMLVHSKVTIAESLTRLPESHEEAAVQNFRNILVWMGDRPAQECQRIASRDQVVAIVSSEPLMRDEAFLQLLKQLTKNPSLRSEWLGWQLLLQLCRTAAPSDELVDFVRYFCAQKARSATPIAATWHGGQREADARSWELTRLASQSLEALGTSVSSNSADNDRSGDMVGVVVYLVDGSSQNLFVPVRTTLQELSSQLGDSVGVKHWRDFALFQVTDASELPRMLPDLLVVSELTSLWQQLKEATGLQGHLHWRRRFLRHQEMLLGMDPYHAALTFRQAVLCHLSRPAPCQLGSEIEQLTTAAALLCLDSDNPSQKIKDNDILVQQLIAGVLRGKKPRQQDEIRQTLQEKVQKLQPQYGPRVPQLQRMSRALALMQCFPYFGAHCWSAKQIAPGRSALAGLQVAVTEPPPRWLSLHGRQAEPELWIYVDTTGVHVAPATGSDGSGALTWTFHFQEQRAASKSIEPTSKRSTALNVLTSMYKKRSTMEAATSDDGWPVDTSAIREATLRRVGRLLRWGARPGLLQLVVHTADPAQSGSGKSHLVSLECSGALDAAFVVHCALCESLQVPTTCT